MFDATFNESEMDYITTTLFGKKDVDYTVNKDGAYNTLIKDMAEQRKKGIGVFTFGNAGPDIAKKFSPQRYAYADQKCNYPGYVYPIIPSTDVAMKNGQTLAKIASEAYIKIMTGEKPIDYFDEFVKQFNANGGTESEKAMTDAYKKMIGK